MKSPELSNMHICHFPLTSAPKPPGLCWLTIMFPLCSFTGLVKGICSYRVIGVNFPHVPIHWWKNPTPQPPNPNPNGPIVQPPNSHPRKILKIPRFLPLASQLCSCFEADEVPSSRRTTPACPWRLASISGVARGGPPTRGTRGVENAWETRGWMGQKWSKNEKIQL